LTSFVASLVGACCCWLFPKIEMAVYKKLPNYNQLADEGRRRSSDLPNQEMVELQYDNAKDKLQIIKEEPNLQTQKTKTVNGQDSSMPLPNNEKFLVGIISNYSFYCIFFLIDI
jgi:hypothetical protein